MNKKIALKKHEQDVLYWHISAISVLLWRCYVSTKFLKALSGSLHLHFTGDIEFLYFYEIKYLSVYHIHEQFVLYLSDLLDAILFSLYINKLYNFLYSPFHFRHCL